MLSACLSDKRDHHARDLACAHATCRMLDDVLLEGGKVVVATHHDPCRVKVYVVDGELACWARRRTAHDASECALQLLLLLINGLRDTLLVDFGARYTCGAVLGVGTLCRIKHHGHATPWLWAQHDVFVVELEECAEYRDRLQRLVAAGATMVVFRAIAINPIGGVLDLVVMKRNATSIFALKH